MSSPIQNLPDTPLGILRRAYQILEEHPERWRKGSVGHNNNMCLLGILDASARQPDLEAEFYNRYFGDAFSPYSGDCNTDPNAAYKANARLVLQDIVLGNPDLKRLYGEEVEQLGIMEMRDGIVRQNDDPYTTIDYVKELVRNAMLQAAFK